jgi:exodeoxyribonuclease VII large subunit
VQGEGAGLKIAEAIGRLNRLRGLDLMILGRGGGSLEDLWAFNEECVAKAIFSSRVPVVAGVGHETDLTIADLVADVRAATPSEAAERVVPSREEVVEGLRGTAAQMRALLAQKVQRAHQRLADLGRRRCFRLPLERVREQERLLDDWAGRLARAMRHRLVLAKQKVEAQAGQLETLSPLNVLARGYSLTWNLAHGRVVRSAEEVRPGDQLVTTVRHGQIISRVENDIPTKAGGS